MKKIWSELEGADGVYRGTRMASTRVSLPESLENMDTRRGVVAASKGFVVENAEDHLCGGDESHFDGEFQLAFNYNAPVGQGIDAGERLDDGVVQGRRGNESV